MRPVLFILPLPVFGPVAVKSYGVMLMFGFLFGLWLALRRARQEKVNSDIIWDIWVYALLSGIVGSRTLYVLENLDQFRGRWLDVFRIWEGGLSFYGGFAVGTLGLWLLLWLRKIPILKMCDIMAVSLVLGMSFGKIGCFMNGCCFGRPTDGPVAVSFPARTPIDSHGRPRMSPAYQWQLEHGLITAEAARSLPVHPVQLYESATALVIFVVLLSFYRHRRRYGEISCLLGTIYPVARFFLEFFREKQEVLVFGATSAQVYSVIAFVVFATLFVISRRSQPVLIS